MNTEHEARLALPGKGALESATLAFLAECGMKVNRSNPRQYLAPVRLLYRAKRARSAYRHQVPYLNRAVSPPPRYYTLQDSLASWSAGSCTFDRYGRSHCRPDRNGNYLARKPPEVVR